MSGNLPQNLSVVAKYKMWNFFVGFSKAFQDINLDWNIIKYPRCPNIKWKIGCVCSRPTDWNRNGNWSKLWLVSDEEMIAHVCFFCAVGIELKKAVRHTSFNQNFLSCLEELASTINSDTQNEINNASRYSRTFPTAAWGKWVYFFRYFQTKIWASKSPLLPLLFDHEFPHGLLTKMDSFLKDFLMDSLLKSYKLSQTYKIMDWLFQKCPRPLSCLATSPAWALLEEKSFNPWPETLCFIQKEKLWHLKCSRDGKRSPL